MLDPSVRAVLRSRYTIRRFFTIYGAIFAFTLLLIGILAASCSDGWIKDAALGLLGNFAAALAIFILTYAFYILITSPELRNVEVIPLRDVEISDEIIDLPADASDYYFWGRSGSYFRAEVLPRLNKLAKKHSRHIQIRLVLPDPDVEGNGRYYKKIKTMLGEEADDKTLAANVVATIVSLVIATSNNRYLQAEIGLCATVPTLRFDISTSGALVTRDAKKLPAILTNSGNPFYEMFRDAVLNELAQSRKVQWQNVTSVDLKTNTISEELLSRINGFPKVDLDLIARAEALLQKPEHRYGR